MNPREATTNHHLTTRPAGGVRDVQFLAQLGNRVAGGRRGHTDNVSHRGEFQAVPFEQLQGILGGRSGQGAAGHRNMVNVLWPLALARLAAPKGNAQVQKCSSASVRQMRQLAGFGSQ